MREQIDAALVEAKGRLSALQATHAELTRQMQSLNAQGVQCERDQLEAAGEIKALEALLKGLV